MIDMQIASAATVKADTDIFSKIVVQPTRCLTV
jgi:hypothetical protein